jgi:hypothetical protein
MDIRVEHHTTRNAARNKLESLLDQLAEEHKNLVSDLVHEWRDDVLNFAFKAHGFKVGGTLEVNDSDLRLKGKLPLLAIPFEPKIRHMIEAEAKKVFPEKKKRKAS